jgi:hypothetical protein
MNLGLLESKKQVKEPHIEKYQEATKKVYAKYAKD